MRMPVDRKHPSKQPGRSGFSPLAPPRHQPTPMTLPLTPPPPSWTTRAATSQKLLTNSPRNMTKSLRRPAHVSVWRRGGGRGAKNTSVTKTTRSHLRPSVTLHVSPVPAWETGSKRTPDGKTQGNKESYIKTGIVPPSLSLCSDYQNQSWNRKTGSACIKDTNSQSLRQGGNIK